MRVKTFIWLTQYPYPSVRLQEKNPDIALICQTAYQFTDDFVNSLKNQNNSEFKDSYYQADIIVIEDIESLKKKKRTQVEMAALISELTIRDKIIVLTLNNSEGIKKELPKIIRKVIKPFGLISLDHPSFEARKRVARQLLRNLPLDEPESVSYYLSRYCCSSISELKNIINFYETQGVDMGEELTIEWLDEHQFEFINEI